MQIIFDEAKDAENKRKHGVSLAEAEGLDWDDALTWLDTRRVYGEARMIALGAIDGLLYCAVYVDREGARRVISLRKANYREGLHYANQI